MSHFIYYYAECRYAACRGTAGTNVINTFTTIIKCSINSYFLAEDQGVREIFPNKTTYFDTTLSYTSKYFIPHWPC